jgi:hypothetical protein
MTQENYDELVQRLTKELTDRGQLIEAGWVSLHMLAYKGARTPAQLADLRMIFFAGAHHVFASLLSILDPDEEPTDKDLERIGLIDRELRAYLQEFKRRHGLDN